MRIQGKETRVTFKGNFRQSYEVGKMTVSEKYPSFNQLTLPYQYLLIKKNMGHLIFIAEVEASRVHMLSTYPSDISAHWILEEWEPHVDWCEGEVSTHGLSLFFFFLNLWTIFSYFFFNFFIRNSFIYLLIYLFLAVLGLRFCARAFSSCGKWGPLFIAVRRPLTIAAFLVAEHRLQTRRLSSCGSRA